MANRRMFSKSITNSSRFLMMPQSAQNLYFHLGMNADDDGFCEHFTIMRMTDSKPDDLKILMAKEFVYIFDDKVLIILEWKENNYIQKDRYDPSKYLKIYKEELKALSNQAILKMDTECIQDGYKLDTQVRLGKVRLGKERIGKKREEKVEDKSSTPPFSKTLEEIPQKHLDLCKLLKTLMLQNNPKAFIPKSFTEWANSVRLMIKIDNHTLEEIKRLIIWSQQHNFWKNNIESMPKLRAKFGRLWGEMISSSYQQKEREEIEYKPL